MNTTRQTTIRSDKYYRFLNGVLNRKLVMLGVVLLILGGTGYIARELQTEFIPREDQGLFQIDLTLSEGSRVELSDQVALHAKEIVESVGGSDVAHVYALVGLNPALVSSGGEPTGPQSRDPIRGIAHTTVA